MTKSSVKPIMYINAAEAQEGERSMQLGSARKPQEKDDFLFVLEVGQNYESTITNEGFEIGNECHSEILTSLKISEYQSEQIWFRQKSSNRNKS